METLYHQTSQLIQEASDLFHKLENYPANYNDIENEIQNKINAISRNCEKLDFYVFKTPLNQRPTAKMRVDQLKYDNSHIQASLTNNQNKRLRHQQDLAEREQLLSRRFGPGNDHTAVTVDYSAQEQMSLQNSHRNVDEMLHTGSSILETLRYNRDTLKGAQRRLMDLANTLGLSNATISLIERRVSQDKYVLFGGMFVTLAVVILVIIYFV